MTADTSHVEARERDFGNSAMTRARARGKPVCGAKTRSGAPCQAPVVKGKKRCRRHGGENPGAPARNKRAWKHGIYSRMIHDDERELFAELKGAVGTLDNEIAVLRLQLYRTLAAQNCAIEDAADTTSRTGGLELQKYHEREASEFTAGDEHVFERVDYNARIDRLTARIASLEKTRAELIEAARVQRENANPEDDSPLRWAISVVPA